MNDGLLKRAITRTGLAANILKTQLTRKIITSDKDKEKHWLNGVTDPEKITKIRDRIKRDHGNPAILEAKPLDRPDHLILYVTGKCGAKCGFCFYGNEINQKDPVTGEFYELSMDVIRKISTDLGKLNQVAFTGGDPFLRTDLAKIVQIFWMNNKPEAIHIPTNGLPVVLVKKTVTEILETIPTDLTVAMSIDAVGELYDKVRGVPGNFVKMMEMYDMLAVLKKEYDGSNKKKGTLHLVVNSVITNQTYKDAPNLMKNIREMMPLVDLNDFDFVRGDPYNSSFMLPSFNELLDFRKLIFENFENYYKGKLGLALKKYQYDLNLETIQKKTQVLPCVAGETFITISERGESYFCELREPIGNIKNNTISEIWHGERANKLRESIHKKECHCTHGCYQPLAILYNKGGWFKALKYVGYMKHKLPEPDVHRVEDTRAAKIEFEGQTNIGDSVPVQMPGEGGGLLWGKEAISPKSK